MSKFELGNLWESGKTSSEPELNPMERWNVGVLGIESGESAPFGSGALR
jgi:hypothetical protein